MGYLSDWEESVNNRPGDFSKSERKRMLLSDATMLGLKLTSKKVTVIRDLHQKVPHPTKFSPKSGHADVKQHPTNIETTHPNIISEVGDLDLGDPCMVFSLGP